METLKTFIILKETLEEGCYSFVKIAVKISNSARMAVKFIPKMKILRPELLDSEINIMKQINHPSIIQLYETLRQSIFVPLYGELFERISKVDHFSEQQACGLFF